MILELQGLKKVRERERIKKHLYPDWYLQKKELGFAIEQFQSDLRAIEAELKVAKRPVYRRKGYFFYEQTLVESVISAIHSAIEESEK